MTPKKESLLDRIKKWRLETYQWTALTFIKPTVFAAAWRHRVIIAMVKMMLVPFRGYWTRKFIRDSAKWTPEQISHLLAYSPLPYRYHNEVERKEKEGKRIAAMRERVFLKLFKESGWTRKPTLAEIDAHIVLHGMPW